MEEVNRWYTLTTSVEWALRREFIICVTLLAELRKSFSVLLLLSEIFNVVSYRDCIRS